jgi:quercetin dioxygenase-like cupin family protein
MKRICSIIALAALSACAPRNAAVNAPTTASWDDAAAAELQAGSEAQMKAWEVGDVAAIRAGIANDGFLTSYDLDMMGQPVSFASGDEVAAYAQKMADAMKAMGATCQMKITKNDCKATAAIGACVTEVEANMTMAGKTETMWFRGTSVARKGEDGWKWTHWHGSLAKLPPMPATPAAMPAIPPAPKPAGEPIALKNKDLKWETPPGAPKGLKVATTWGDPMKGANAGYVQFPAGFKMPRHYHTASMWVHVLQGSMKVTFVDGKVVELKAGDFGYAPAKAQHTTESKNGVTLFQYADAAVGDVLVDDQGNPLPPPAPAAAAPAAPAAAGAKAAPAPAAAPAAAASGNKAAAAPAPAAPAPAPAAATPAKPATPATPAAPAVAPAKPATAAAPATPAAPAAVPKK